jgi:hypothetical protein
VKNGAVAIAAGLALAAVLGTQIYGLLRLSALEARIERGVALSQLALTRAAAKPAAPLLAGVALQPGNCAGPSAEELRGIVKQELANVAAKASADAERDIVRPDPIENADAFRNAERIVRDALAAHVWSEQDATQLRNLRHQLTEEQLRSLNAQLIPAMNRQELRVDAVPPF